MVDMFKMANIFQTNHRNGTVSNVTDYSFKFTTAQKNDKGKEVIYFESYFVELQLLAKQKESNDRNRQNGTGWIQTTAGFVKIETTAMDVEI